MAHRCPLPSGGMSAAGESGLCIVFTQPALTLADGLHLEALWERSSRASGFPLSRITRQMRLPSFRYAPLDLAAGTKIAPKPTNQSGHRAPPAQALFSLSA